MAEEQSDRYQQELEARIKKSIDTPESSFGRGVKRAALGALITIMSLTGVNYLANASPDKDAGVYRNKTYYHMVVGKGKITGVTSYAHYTVFRYNDFKEVGPIEMVTCGSLFGGSEDYIDLNSDGKVDRIWLAEKVLIRRSSDYDDYKDKFDQADKLFIKYKKEFLK